MILRKNILGLLVFLLLLTLSAQAQEANQIAQHIIQQLKAFPQEKTYMHTDATDYAIGDRIWVKVYVVNALMHEPTEESRYVYVELADNDGVVQNRVKLMNREGIYAGYVDIPTTAEGGKYFLRAYTELMGDTKGYEDVKCIYVTGKTKSKEKKKKYGKSQTTAQDHPRIIHYERQGNDIKVRIDRSLHQKEYHLLAHCRGYPFLIRKIKKSQVIVLHNDSLPNGIISLMLFDGRWNLVGQRQLFNKNSDELCQLQLSTDKEQYQTMENVSLKLAVPDLRKDERADISISVTGPITTQGHRPSSILAHLLLANDLENGTDHPEWYYDHPEAADTLVDYKPWKRYNMEKVVKGEFNRPSIAPETSQRLSGKVRTLLFKKPVKNATVTLISPQSGKYAVTHTDEHGLFTFDGIDSPESTSFVLKAETQKGNERIELRLNEQQFPPFPTAAYDNREEEVVLYNEDISLDSLMRLYNDAIFLDDVEVKGIRRNSATEGDPYALIADVSFGVHQIEDYGVTCLHELLRRIPGVFEYDGQYYLRSRTSIQSDNPIAFAIDGILMDEEYDIDNIQMQDVARVDVFKSGSVVIWGARGGSGVISITTKNGVYAREEIEKVNMKNVTPLGYQKHTPFHHPSGMRKTLYWNPSITTDTLEFQTSEIPGECRIVIEGVTSEGRLIHEEHLIKVGGAIQQ